MPEEKLKILVVDDEPHIIYLLKLSIDRQKYDIDGAHSTRECLRLVKKNRYNLFIIDILMTGINGYELCYKLKHMKKTKNVPVIILSCKGQIHDKLHAIDVGADDYVTKPFDPSELERRIKLNLGQ